MEKLLVSCIMPTANRHKYIPFALNYFLYQDYPNRELIIIDDGIEPVSNLLPDDPRIKYYYSKSFGKIGTKRNIACEKSNGEIIVHLDDDDWYAPDWVTVQVQALISSGADVCGIAHVSCYSPIQDTLWKGTILNNNNPLLKPWLSGDTLAYRKTYWRDHPFMDLQTGEDDGFVSVPGAKVFAHDYLDGFLAILHGRNTTTKFFEYPTRNRQKIYKSDDTNHN